MPDGDGEAGCGGGWRTRKGASVNGGERPEGGRPGGGRGRRVPGVRCGTGGCWKWSVRGGGAAWQAAFRGCVWRAIAVCTGIYLPLSFPSPPHLPLLTPAVVMFRRRTVYIFLSLLAAVLIGTVVVLSSISYYLSIDIKAYVTEAELDAPFNSTVPWNATEHGKVERIPRILHQTWKTEVLPEKWADVSQGCRDLMPD